MRTMFESGPQALPDPSESLDTALSPRPTAYDRRGLAPAAGARSSNTVSRVV